jgi:precorrin-6B C5,15-methyltransferase / cobalt-precorrin-6B C5,C15-methyltransferase
VPGQLLWDVGAGSGSIAIEWLRAAPGARAIAIERDAERAERIGRNALRLGVPALEVVTGAAPRALEGLDAPDAIFIGGGLTTGGLLDRCREALPPGGRLVANVVTIEGEGLLAQAHERWGGRLVRLAVQRAEPLGGLTGWRPAMSVTQWELRT